MNRVTKRVRYRQQMAPASGVGEGKGLSFDELVEVLYRVLRRHPEAMADVEEAFLGMAKKELANPEPH